MSRSITSYRRMTVHFDFKAKGLQLGYATALSKVAKNYNLAFSVVTRGGNRLEGLEVCVSDKLGSDSILRESFEDQIRIYHIGTDFEPNVENLFVDAMFAALPSQKSLNRAILRALKLKKTKVQLQQELLECLEYLGRGEIDAAVGKIRSLETMDSIIPGIISYMHAKSETVQQNFEQAFDHYAAAVTKSPNNPLYMYDMGDFLYQLRLKQEALSLLTKYVQKFPRNQTIIQRGIELSIHTKNFDYLDLFFKGVSADVAYTAEDFRTIYNAGLSVYIRYLLRGGRHEEIAVFLKKLAQSSQKPIHWQNMLAELIPGLPVKYWKTSYPLEVGEVIRKIYPEVAQILDDLVNFGLGAARATCALKDNSSGEVVKKLIANILSPTLDRERL